MRAPVLAAMFVTMALLAMLGLANFVGEFYILNGIFQEKVVYAFVASVGIALAAYYALRSTRRCTTASRRGSSRTRWMGAVWRDRGADRL